MGVQKTYPCLPLARVGSEELMGVFDWELRASRFLAWSTFSIEKVLHAKNREALGVSGVSVARWVNGWPTDLAVASLGPARGEICSTVNGVPLHTAFQYHPPIVLIWLKYCWKERKFANYPPINWAFQVSQFWEWNTFYIKKCFSLRIVKHEAPGRIRQITKAQIYVFYQFEIPLVQDGMKNRS